MLKITIPEQELFDERSNEFVHTKAVNLTLEHSLVSISKWESIYCKPFIDTTNQYPKTDEEVLKYIECMTITQNVDPKVYRFLPPEEVEKIKKYIASPLSATTFSEVEGKAPSREKLTSEVLYYYMTVFNIPFSCEKWPIQRLTNLIKICSIKNSPKKKVSKSDYISKRNSINSQRRKMLGSHG